MYAYTLTRPYVPFGESYPVRDAEIIACNREAATIFGYDSPDLVVGKMLSDTQPLHDRQLGRAAYVLRGAGVEIPKVYCCRVERPDGEIVTVRKNAVDGVQMRSNGLDVMLTKMELVKQPCNGLPDPAKYGMSDEQIRNKIGWTIREVVEGNLFGVLQLPDNLTMILSEHRELLSSVNGPLFSWSTETNNVKRRIVCPECGWLYWSGFKVAHPQCSQCGWTIDKGWRGRRTQSKRGP